jgi:hypothetical protein
LEEDEDEQPENSSNRQMTDPIPIARRVFPTFTM